MNQILNDLNQQSKIAVEAADTIYSSAKVKSDMLTYLRAVHQSKQDALKKSSPKFKKPWRVTDEMLVLELQKPQSDLTAYDPCEPCIAFFNG